MIRWLPYVFVRIVFFFIGGIFTAIYFPSFLSLLTASILLIIFTICYCTLAWLLRSGSAFSVRGETRIGVGAVGLAAIFVAGYVHTIFSNEKNNVAHLTRITEPIEYYRVTLTGLMRENENAWRTEGKVTAVKYASRWHANSGRVLLYFSKRYFTTPFKHGDVLLVRGSYQAIATPANPGEFDYAKFSAFKNIFHQHFLLADKTQRVGQESPLLLMEYAYKCREWVEFQLKKYVQGKQEQGIILALVLGITDGLDDDLLSAYAATGAMHVLAVSGLHVGIIYGLLLLLLKPMSKYKWGKWFIALVSIVVLWSYAFITGLSPSVLRAVAMFSFVAFARPLGYRTNIYNTLALSAFVLLVCDPFLIMSVGFQLSYLAVLGILYIHPDLFSMYETENKVLRWLWQATSISIAAQAATFALGLLYFHQFPNYFVFSNLLVIPLSSCVLIAGLALLAFAFIPFIANVIGYCITFLIKLMNFFVFYFESLPFSITDNVYVNTVQCWLIMGIVISLVLMFKYRRFSYLIAATSITIVLATLQWYHFFQDISRQKISVYKIAGHTAIDLIDNGHTFFLSDSALLADGEKIRFHIAPHRLICGIQAVDLNVPLEKLRGCDFISWNGKSILRIHHPDFNIPKSIEVDYLILSNNAVKKISDIDHLVCGRVIIDSSNSYAFVTKLLKQVSNRKNVYSVLHHGAFVEEIKD